MNKPSLKQQVATANSVIADLKKLLDTKAAAYYEAREEKQKLEAQVNSLKIENRCAEMSHTHWREEAIRWEERARAISVCQLGKDVFVRSPGGLPVSVGVADACNGELRR